ncbi:uncharacterized protein LOC130687748 [Daphnia carinata]|uniref:uncharacterized protein LOC130687748 n=1 Tax=Daphnia carinata TaxID=120202 RepID=UPI00257ED449|nr:uncharacterized protein LOC130687748 [Daphnia carinata]XP_057366988.1 uncharacterized protein LOC130687748 [Daphnia carinata]
MAPFSNCRRCAVWFVLASFVWLHLLDAAALEPNNPLRRVGDDSPMTWRRRHSRDLHHLHLHHDRDFGRAGASDDQSGRHRRSEWSCPQVSHPSRSPGISCQCDLPHTLRCSAVSGGHTSGSNFGSSESERQVAAVIGALRALPREQSVSLLDLSIQNFSRLGPFLFERVTLHGLVISSGEIQDVSAQAFAGLASSLTALGLPNNRLVNVPSEALRPLIHLERLDLSNNRIQSIAGQPFAGLDRLRFLDLSGNALETIAPTVFGAASGLRSLQLRSNLLETSQLVAPALSGLKKLQELDLGYNRLRGRLTSTFLQGLDNLITLELTGNNLTLLKRGMLSGLKRLRTLRLARNQIDVIEDQSFVSLASLTTLDLSHNGVVAISGQSLSHLNDLTQLDLSHNYLRAVTSELVGGLSSLESLDLTDNDISLVEPGALTNLPKLIHLSLTDNPLNCDCHLVDLARWLRNSTGNKPADDQNRRSAVCATPPSLENGLLFEAEIETLTCETNGNGRSGSLSTDAQQEGDESNNFLSSQPTEDFIRLSTAQVQFGSAELEGSLLHTVWKVDSATLPYTCDAILVYELSEEHEALLDSYPVRCHSEERPNKQLQLTVKLSDNMKTDGQYRLCLVLFEGGHDDEASLLPGCSHSMTWQTLKHHDEEADETTHESGNVLSDHASSGLPVTAMTTQITAFYANVSSPQSVSVYMRIPDALPTCQFTVAVFEKHRLLALKRLNCSTTSFTFGQLMDNRNSQFATSAVEHPVEEYQVCATFAQQGQFLPPPDGERQADGDIVLTASKGRSSSSIAISSNAGGPSMINSTVVQYEHCVVAKVPNRIWAVENTLVVIAVTVVFVLIAAALLLLTYLLARRVFFRRSKLLWCSSSSDPLSSSVPKATSRHILYVPESDYFTDSACSSSGSDNREETSTNV